MKQKASQVRAGQLALNQTHPISPPPNRTSPRAATRLLLQAPAATPRHTCVHGSPCLRPQSVPAPHSSATIVVQARFTLRLRRALEARRRRVNRSGLFKCLWKTCGKPVENLPHTPPYEASSVENHQLIHTFSTGFPQVIHRPRPHTPYEGT
jgi:hypothetical protein